MGRRNGKSAKQEREGKINRKIVSSLVFKSANAKSHTHTHTHTSERLRGWDFYNQIRTECSFPCRLWPHFQAHCFLLPKTPDAFWHCFLLFFMIICIHQFCIDSPTPTPLPPSLQDPRRKDKYRNTRTQPLTHKCIYCAHI